MSDPTTNNKTADMVSKILKDLETMGLSSVETSLIAQYPFLGFPFVKQIFEFILGKVADVIYENAAIASTKIVIDFQINQEKSQVISSFQNLQMAVASGDPNAISIASKDLSNAYGNIIHSDGWSSPH